MNYRKILLLSSAFACAGPALSYAADQAAPPKAGDTKIEEIIVTAEHRSVSIQKIPLAVTALSSRLLDRENISSASQLQNLVPGLKILEIGVQPSIFIRGIGGPVANVLNDPDASYNVDGVAVSRPISINGLLFDLERAEVLKGPQGTLYGGNSTVGAINIVSRVPDFRFGGYGSVEYGNYAEVKTQGAVNVPLSSNFAVRASFETNKHNGYISNGSDDADDVGARIRALYRPTDYFEALVTGTYFHSGGIGPGDVPLKNGSVGFQVPSNPWYVGIGPDVDNGGLQVPNNGYQRLLSRAVSGQFKLRTGIGTLTVIPSYIDTKYRALAYDGGFSKDYHERDTEAGIEARLASNDDSGSRLKWQVGGIYQNVHQISDVVQHVGGVGNFPPGPPVYQNLPLNLTTKSYGLFGQATYRVLDRLRFTAGLRYTNDQKTVTGTNNTYLFAPNGFLASSFPDSGAATFSNVDYRVGFDYDLTSQSLLYGNISSGYKTGGINPGFAPNTYQPEHITSYQLGVKNTLFDQRLQLNLEGWYWDYRDFQVEQFIPLNTPTGQTFGFGTTNAKRAENYGIEAMATVRVTSHDRLALNLQYDIAKYTDFTQALSFPVPSTVDYAGQTVPFAPEWSGNVNFEHTFDLTATTQLIASVNDSFQSPVLATIQAFPGQHIHTTNVTDAQLTLSLGDGKWQIGAYAENLQNEPVLLFAGATPAGVWGHPRPPRTYGIRATAKF